MPESTPIEGDLLVTSREGRHFVSIVPESALISFEFPSGAWAFARRWIDEHPSATLWYQEGDTIRLMTFADLPRPPG